MPRLSTFAFLALVILVTWQEDSILKNPGCLDLIAALKDLQVATTGDLYLFSNSILWCNKD